MGDIFIRKYSAFFPDVFTSSVQVGRGLALFVKTLYTPLALGVYISPGGVVFTLEYY